MMCAGLIPFRASLIAMRRTSWIDQRINDGVSVLLWLQLDVAFFLAATDWRDGGSPPSWRRRASLERRGDATQRARDARSRPRRSQTMMPPIRRRISGELRPFVAREVVVR